MVKTFAISKARKTGCRIISEPFLQYNAVTLLFQPLSFRDLEFLSELSTSFAILALKGF